MNKDTINLLNECSSGCQMAVSSMSQIEKFISNEILRELIRESKYSHSELGTKCRTLLNKSNNGTVEPSPVAKAMAWVGTEAKLMMNDDTKEVAKLLVDGCNMGIKNVSGYINEYHHADNNAKRIAANIVTEEKQLVEKLLQYV